MGLHSIASIVLGCAAAVLCCCCCAAAAGGGGGGDDAAAAATIASSCCVSLSDSFSSFLLFFFRSPTQSPTIISREPALTAMIFECTVPPFFAFISSPY